MDFEKAREIARDNPGSTIRPAPDGEGHVVYDAHGKELALTTHTHDVPNHPSDTSDIDPNSGNSLDDGELGATERAHLLARIRDLERDRVESLTLLADSQALVEELRRNPPGNSFDAGKMQEQLASARSQASEYKSEVKRLRKQVASLKQELGELKKAVLSLVSKQVAKVKAEESAKRRKLEQKLSECRRKVALLQGADLMAGPSEGAPEKSGADAKRINCRCMGEVENCHWCDGKGYYFTDAQGHRS
jgi:hypothetical protein